VQTVQNKVKTTAATSRGWAARHLYPVAARFPARFAYGPCHLAGGLLGILLLILAGSGCQSTSQNRPFASSLASVTVRDRITEHIRQVTMDVFKENQFQVGYAGPEKLVFEKPGSFMNELAYGSWMDSEVWIRVKLYISRFGDNSHVVACDAFVVRDRGQPAFEEEIKLSKVRRGPYRKMLKEIRDRLNPPPS